MTPVRADAELRRGDALARLRAQSEFRRPVVLEAGAGTGKTTTLVARVLAWSLGEGWRRQAERLGAGRRATADAAVAAAVLRRVVAITFTEAAAAEMASRIGEELAALARGRTPVGLAPDGLPAEPEERQRRARALAGALDHLAVRTIHAFCRSLLADHPLEAGLHPHFEVDATGLAVEQVCREVVEAAVERVYGGSGDETFLTLAARGIGPQALAGALVEMAQQGLTPAVLEDDPLAPPRLVALHRRLAEAVEELAAAVAPLAGIGRRSRTSLAAVEAAEESRRLLARLAGSDLRLDELATGLAELWPGNLEARLAAWTAGRFSQGEAAALGVDAAALPPRSAALLALLQHLRRLDPELLQAGRRALLPLLREVHRLLESRGVMTFTALLTRARELLESRPAVRRSLRRRIDQLLVDEFQDTDRLQCDLIRRLALEGPPDERPGLFLVGDPKQSIYGWRSADLEAYDAFLDEVRAAGGEVHALSENFRSVPAVLQEVAWVVEPVMEARHGLQPAFQPLFACAARAADAGFRDLRRRPVEHWVSWGPEAAATRAATAAALEARALAGDLLELRQAGVEWGQVGVLLRSTGEIDVYLDALRRAGIPFAVGRDTQYYQRREIIEAAALVRCVLDPGDQLALLTFLRSPMVGVPDAALLPLWAAGLPSQMIELEGDGVAGTARRVARELPAGVPGLERVSGWEENLAAAAAILGHLRRAYRESTAAGFVELLRRLSLQEVLESARYLGRYRLANLERFYRQLEEALDQGADATALLRLLRRSVAESAAAEEGRLLDSGADAVQVLTIHGAKGLGFEHVYLLQLHKSDPPSHPPSVAFGVAGERFEYTLFGAPTPGFDRLLEAGRAREEAERVRLLYVAMTRAKRRLVMAGCWPAPRAAPPAARSLLDLMARRLPGLPDLPELFSSAGAEGAAPAPFVDDREARWVFPGLAAAAAEDRAEGDQAPLAPIEDGRAAARRLRELRTAAVRRQQRPRAGAPSARAHPAAVEPSPEWAEQLREAAAAGEAAPARFPAAEGARRAAMAAGTVVHRLLEELDLRANPGRELQRRRDSLKAYLPPLLAPEERHRALAQARELVDRLAGGELLARLAALADHVLARELPVLLPAPDGEDGPLDLVSGVIDLLYRDLRTGEVVVADFKTDAVGDPADLDERAAVYAEQGGAYVEAVRQALGLPAPPRFELWFLAADRIVEVKPGP